MCLYVKFLVLLSGGETTNQELTPIHEIPTAEISHTLWYMVFLVVI